MRIETGKYAIVCSKDSSSWKSAATISKNIFKAYTGFLGSEFETFYLSRIINRNFHQLSELADRIFRSTPERIVFTDDVFHPGKLIAALDLKYGEKPLPPLYFHLYGSFNLNSQFWAGLEPILKKTSVHLVCASERQAILVNQVLKNSSNVTSICPFPIDSDVFFQSEAIRRKYRRKLGVHEDEQILLYTGRLSLQKNVIRLVHEIAHLMRNSRRSIRLVLAGTFDDIGLPLFRRGEIKTGSFYPHWLKTIEQLEPWVQERIQYLGPQSPSDLNGLYNAADLFTSLSLYHDEDFGMSPAEALCCGLPVVLTDWGGYAGFDFLKHPGTRKNCSLVTVSLDSNGLSISSESFQKAVTYYLEEPPGDLLKELWGKYSQDYFSISAVSEKLRKIHSTRNRPFPGFSSFMTQQAKAFKAPVPFPEGPKRGTLYEGVYGAYLRRITSQGQPEI